MLTILKNVLTIFISATLGYFDTKTFAVLDI